MVIDAMDITGKDGTEIAHLYIAGKSMTFGNDQRPIKGAGAINGIGEESFSILILPLGMHVPGETQSNKVQRKQITLKNEGNIITFGGGIPLVSGKVPDLENGQVPRGALVLKTGYIIWNDDGSTTSVRDLQPTIACSNGKQVRGSHRLWRSLP